MLFGDVLANCTLAMTAALLLDNAIKPSSKKTCESGQKQFRKFTLQYMGAYFMPENENHLSLRGLLLCFFTASLFLDRKKLKSTTIRNYVGHIRAKWEKTGVNLTVFDKTILSRLLKGVATLRPPTTDKRTAFLLPHFNFPDTFKHPYSRDQLIFKAAVIFGFLGMFRFSTFGKLSCHSVVLISAGRDEFQLRSGTYAELNHLLRYKNIMGFLLPLCCKVPPTRSGLLL